jgi:hypothetical protein
MSAGLEFDFKKSLKKLDCRESDVNELRETIKKFEHVPKKLSWKQVRQSIENIRKALSQ